ncbi:MAG: hypothetical protein CVV18_01935 [Gammaproteobacteria bacterium HGW-Gammaproteobacteria-8]|nr:MAG: hypothetical protein CVV18_01935 [Gammaproteobacteria bacterium HGW-Gammaproteobacteria-8]
MNRNRLILLALATLLLAVVVAVLNRSGDAPVDGAGQPLLPGLAEVVNEIDAIDVVAPGGETIQLRRDQTRWRLPQRDDYEADFARVLELLRNLHEAEIVAQKTSNPEWYARLGVQDPGSPEATGRRIDFPGRELPSIIVGQTDPTDAGSYVRRADEAQSWQLDRVLEVPADPVSWLERGVMDIPAEDIAEVVVRHPDGETIRLRRAGEEGTDFVLLDVPEGRSAGPAWRRTALGNGLRALNLDDVRRFAPPIPDEATSLLFVTTDGLNFVVELFEDEDGHWAHFTVSAEPVPEAASEAETEGGNTVIETAAEALAAEAPAEIDERLAGEPAAASADEGEIGPVSDPNAERLASAVAVDARLSPWLFKIPERRYTDLTVRLETLLEAVGEDD